MNNLMEMYDLSKRAHGGVRFLLIDVKNRVIKRYVDARNQVLFSGADILAALIAGKPGFQISTMYMEFMNLAHPGDPVPIPTYDRTGGIAYYNGLAASPNVDYVRVPLIAVPGIAPSGSHYLGNVVTLFAMSDGLTGFHGKPFSPAANSVVYGGALVATPKPDDQSQDMVFARVYAGSNGWATPIPKEIGHEAGLTWSVTFN